MAYRVEETATGIDIIYDGWEQGIGDSPFSGVKDMREVNLVSMPGVVSVGYPITASTTSGATLGVPISRATQYDNAGLGTAVAYYILDHTGQVWQATSISGTWTFISSNNTTTGASVDDSIWFWKGYLFKTRGNKIDYNPVNNSGSTGAWVNAWDPATGGSGAGTPLTASVIHFAITPQNDQVYICNGNKVASLSEVTTFDPTSTGTYTFTAARFQIAYNDGAKSLAALGSGGANGTFTILVGGARNIIYPFGTAQSILAPGFQTPIFLGDNFVARMVSVNQNAFVFTGGINPQSGAKNGRGRIYISNSVQAQEFKKFPDHLTGRNDPYFQWGDAIYHRNSLIFGCFAALNSDGSGILGFSDVWAIDIETKALRSISTISTGAGYSNASALIAAESGSSSPGYAYMVGWSDGTGGSSRNIGYSGTTSGVNSGGTIIKTDQAPVGTYFDKYTPRNIEVKLQTPLESGESIILVALGDNGTQTANLGTLNDAAISVAAPNALQSLQWLGFQMTVTGNSATSGVRIKEVRVHADMRPIT